MDKGETVASVPDVYVMPFSIYSNKIRPLYMIVKLSKALLCYKSSLKMIPGKSIL